MANLYDGKGRSAQCRNLSTHIKAGLFDHAHSIIMVEKKKGLKEKLMKFPFIKVVENTRW